jgi:diguanylate cyclase (GGDEF)-like protein
VTRIPNRRLLLDRLQQALSGESRSSAKKAVLFVDLDDFKTLNETLGHQIGDLLLHEVAQRLTSCVHEADTVARFGADEFVVVLEGLSELSEEAADAAGEVGQKILAAVSQPYTLAGRDCHSTASIGVAVFGDARETPNDVLQQADIAMSQAKNHGGDGMRFFAPALQAAVNARAALREDLSHAIQANQFLLYYQPQVNADGLIGAEALIRWQHPVRGLVSPYDFIPLAEETGLILSLGDLVLKTACLQIALWAARKLLANVQIAVNISARQFAQPDFVQPTLAILAQTRVNPKNLKLELTESMLASDMTDVIAKMTILKSHGLSFSLDDFGTGYSSLSYLKKLPLDQLKIDRAFVQDILEDVASAAIAQTIVSLGRAMGLSVVAEGVENEEQRKFLASLGTHSFQGYLYSRPLPLEEFERLWLGSVDQTPAVLN